MAKSVDPHPDDGFLDRLLDVPVLMAPSISPNGSLAAWSWGGRGAAAESYLRAVTSEDKPARFSAERDDIVVQSWRADSVELLLALTKDGDERVRLMRSRIDQLKPVALTQEKPDYYITGGELHPNGRWLIYAANVDPATGRETESSAIFRQDMTTGERLVLARPERGSRSPPMLNTPGTQVLYSRKDRHPAGRQYWLVDIDGRNDHEILNLGAEVNLRASWAPSGQLIVIVADSETHRRVGYWMQTAPLIHWLFDDPNNQIESAFIPFGVNAMVVIEERDGGKRPWLYDFNTRKRQTWLTLSEGTLLPVAPLAGGDWAARYYHARQPGDLVRVGTGPDGRMQIASLTGLTGIIGSLPGELVAPENFRWNSTDGLPIQGWLYRAKEPARGTVVQIHGGPTYHIENRFDALTQYFLRRGFNVFLPNYRGSTGFGLPFQNAIRKEGWGGAEQEDIRSGIAALIERGIAAKGRIGVTGVSYGGYSAWWAITHFPPELVAAAAPICGMTDLSVDYETTRPDLRPYSEEMMGGSPAQVPARYRERSPIHYVGNIKGRLLIVQGMRDPNVTPKNLAVARRALEHAKVAHDVLTFEDEGHGIRKRANNRILYRRLADFFEAAFAATPFARARE